MSAGQTESDSFTLKPADLSNYFAEITPDRSLIVYYANYSNPFSSDDARRYAVVGISRVKKLGEIEYYENCSTETKKQYGGGFVWQRNVQSSYPEQGFRIPYHRYLSNPDVLRRIQYAPENPRNFKYGTRYISDDNALAIVERFILIADTLKDIGDRAEDWTIRTNWLRGLIAELWQHRGLYPGLASVLEVIGFQEAISFFRSSASSQNETDAHSKIFSCLEGNWPTSGPLRLGPERAKKVTRAWKLRDKQEQALLRDALPRFALTVGQVERILSISLIGMRGTMNTSGVNAIAFGRRDVELDKAAGAWILTAFPRTSAAIGLRLRICDFNLLGG